VGLRSDDYFGWEANCQGDRHRPACQEHLLPDFNSSVLDLCDSTGRRRGERNSQHILMQQQKLRPQAQDLIIAALLCGAIPNFEM
jgi:hypothetical protein